MVYNQGCPKYYIPPFLEKRKELPPEEIEVGRKIASLRIHVERAIWRIIIFWILKSTIPINMIRLTNQIYTLQLLTYHSSMYPGLLETTGRRAVAPGAQAWVKPHATIFQIHPAYPYFLTWWFSVCSIRESAAVWVLGGEMPIFSEAHFTHWSSFYSRLFMWAWCCY